MKRKLGFTLVELLVVIAIISILASIAVPKVSQYLVRARVTKAESEIKNAETALMAMIANLGRNDFNQIFTKATGYVRPKDIEATLEAAGTAQNIYDVYGEIFYDILRRGQEAGNVKPGEWYWKIGTDEFKVQVDASLLKKLGTGGQELLLDPWGKRYQFVMGPLPRDYTKGLVPFLRCYRGDDYLYNASADGSGVPGDPQRDDLAGFPAPFDKPVYIYSAGADEEFNQGGAATGELPGRKHGGGDDINNWDGKSGWSDLY